jgi:glycosyltransferase involved in cell wall biosynthesis
VVEALAAGLPCVVSHTTGSSVRDGVEGVVGRYDEIDRLTEGVERLVADPAARAEMAAAAYRRHAVHQLEAYAIGLADVLHQAIERRRRES